MLEHEIAELGRRMGIEGFALDHNGLAVLDVEHFGRLTFEQVASAESGEELLVYVALPVPAHDIDACRRVLALCSFEQAHPMPVWGGVRQQVVVLLTRFSSASVRAADMENAALFLRSLLERIV